MSVRALDELNDLLSRPEGRWTLAEGALVASRLERPELDRNTVLAHLDELGVRARAAVGVAWHPRFVAAGIARVLFDEEGFAAIEPGKETPEALMLDRVLETGVGAPVVLSLLFIEIARRAGVRFEPLALPGLALVRHDFGGERFLFDPARDATPMTLEEVRRAVSASAKGKVEFREGWLRPVTREQLLARLIAGLKALYWRGGNYERALAAIQLMLSIRPDDPREIRDSGRLQFLLGRYRDAIDAFESYLSHNPHGEDADAVRMLLLEARAGLSR